MMSQIAITLRYASLTLPKATFSDRFLMRYGHFFRRFLRQQQQQEQEEEEQGCGRTSSSRTGGRSWSRAAAPAAGPGAPAAVEPALPID